MKTFICVVVSSILLTGCQIFGSQDSDSFTITPNDVSIAGKQSESVTFTVINTCASSCWVNIGEKIKREGNTYNISVVAENSGETCLAACLELEKDVTVEIPEPGSYSFQFIHRDSVHHRLELSFP